MTVCCPYATSMGRKGKYVWPSEKENELIGHYESNTALYNTNDSDYHLPNIREKIIREISKEIGVDYALCDSHLKSLRTQYGKFRNELLHRKSGSSPPPPLKGRKKVLMDSLAFLSPYMKQRESKSTLEEIKPNQKSTSKKKKTKRYSLRGKPKLSDSEPDPPADEEETQADEESEDAASDTCPSPSQPTATGGDDPPSQDITDDDDCEYKVQPEELDTDEEEYETTEEDDKECEINLQNSQKLDQSQESQELFQCSGQSESSSVSNDPVLISNRSSQVVNESDKTGSDDSFSQSILVKQKPKSDLDVYYEDLRDINEGPETELTTTEKIMTTLMTSVISPLPDTNLTDLEVFGRDKSQELSEGNGSKSESHKSVCTSEENRSDPKPGISNNNETDEDKITKVAKRKNSLEGSSKLDDELKVKRQRRSGNISYENQKKIDAEKKTKKEDQATQPSSSSGVLQKPVLPQYPANNPEEIILLNTQLDTPDESPKRKSILKKQQNIEDDGKKKQKSTLKVKITLPRSKKPSESAGKVKKVVPVKKKKIHDSQTPSSSDTSGGPSGDSALKKVLGNTKTTPKPVVLDDEEDDSQPTFVHPKRKLPPPVKIHPPGAPIPKKDVKGGKKSAAAEKKKPSQRQVPDTKDEEDALEVAEINRNKIFQQMADAISFGAMQNVHKQPAQHPSNPQLPPAKQDILCDESEEATWCRLLLIKVRRMGNVRQRDDFMSYVTDLANDVIREEWERPDRTNQGVGLKMPKNILPLAANIHELPIENMEIAPTKTIVQKSIQNVEKSAEKEAVPKASKASATTVSTDKSTSATPAADTAIQPLNRTDQDGNVAQSSGVNPERGFNPNLGNIVNQVADNVYQRFRSENQSPGVMPYRNVMMRQPHPMGLNPQSDPSFHQVPLTSMPDNMSLREWLGGSPISNMRPAPPTGIYPNAGRFTNYNPQNLNQHNSQQSQM